MPVLSFLGSASRDAVEREKARYEQTAIELVAEEGGKLVGLLEIECEAAPALADTPGRGGMIWHLAMHPDHQRQGAATALLDEAERRARHTGLVRLEAWTRDDPSVQRWYDGRDDLRQFDSEVKLVKAFGHYTGDLPDSIRAQYPRVHDSVLYEKRL